jgi:hypothetical protein
MRPFHTSRGGRRGTVTIIVISFLLIFFVLALTFAFYSMAEADNAKVYRDSVNLGQNGAFDTGPPPDAEGLFNKALGDIIYGPQDGLPGAFNVLRGHDLARLAYGYNPQDPRGATQAYNGLGRVAITDMFPKTPQPWFAAMPANGQASLANMVNFAWAANVPFMNGMMYNVDNNIYINPATGAITPPDPTWQYRYYAKNANYSYPDANNLFLAIIDPKTGNVICPSYHRRWLAEDPNPAKVGPKDKPPANPLIGPVGGPADPNGPLTPYSTAANSDPWTNPWGRLAILRPRPVDNQTLLPNGQPSGISFFRYPEMNADGSYGDVENIPNKPGGPQLDALWVDLDAPVRRWLGKNYKALYAITILDLDGRVNVNTAGNFNPLTDDVLAGGVPPRYEHTSNHGAFPFEVNPSLVMRVFDPVTNTSNPDINGAAMLSRRPLIPTGSPTAPFYTFGIPATHNRFGLPNPSDPNFPVINGYPDHRYWSYPNEEVYWGLPPNSKAPNTPPPGSVAPFYGQMDFDAHQPNSKSPRYHDSVTGKDTNLVFGPGFIGDFNGAPPSPPRPDPLSRYGNGLYIPGFYDERLNHFSMYNPDLVRTNKSANQTWDRAFGVEEMRVLNEQFNFNPREKFVGSDLATLARNTLGQPYYPPGQPNARFLVTTLSRDIGMPGVSPWRSDVATDYRLPPADPITGAVPGGYPTGTAVTLAPTDWQTPAPGSAGATPDHDQYYRAKLAQLGPVDLDRKLTDFRAQANLPLSSQNIGNYARAIQDRQDLAKDIFDRLRAVTTGAVPPAPGAPMPPLPAPGDLSYPALRWLAQLAVNIVDFIDSDDLSTPFNWNPAFPNDIKNGWVYGFERPRVVMNETYIRYENDPNDMGEPDPTLPQNKRSTKDYTMRCWIELHNPLTPQTPGEQQMDPMGYNSGDPSHGGYRASLEEMLPGMVAQSSYRILIYQVPPKTPATSLKFDEPDNVIGLPAGAGGFPAGGMNSKPRIVKFSGPGVKLKGGSTKTLEPNVGAQANGRSFLILGPTSDGPMGGDAELPDQLQTKADITLDALDLPMVKDPRPDPNVKPDQNPDVNDHNKPKWVPFFVLQRLANPYVQDPGQADPADPASAPNDPRNPWLTIDWIQPDPTLDPARQMPNSIYDHVQFRHDGKRGPDPGSEEMMAPDLSESFSWGRRQPYDARIDFTEQPTNGKFKQATQGGAVTPGKMGAHTFGKVNGKGGNWPNALANPGGGLVVDQSPGSLTANDDTLQFPFLPLNHLDRAVLSPAELFQVAAVKPHQVTHLFKLNGQAPNPRRLAYTANWLDSPDAVNLGAADKSTFLFRALEFLRVPQGMEGSALGGRTAGQMNINTMFTQELLNAIADPSSANRFDQNAVDTAWSNMVTGATGRSSQGLSSPGVPLVSKIDKPFLGLATRVETAGKPAGSNSQDQTIARADGLWQKQMNEDVFRAQSPQPPYLPAGSVEKFELFSKTMNQLTTRSNCFAVYVTIGYFEVMNDGPYNETNRPILGKEMGVDDGSVVRNKFFAVVDRTNLTIEQGPVPGPVKQGQVPVYFRYEPVVNLPTPNITPDPDLRLIPPAPAEAPALTGPTTPGARVAIQIPAVAQTPTAAPNVRAITLTGYYDGMTWTMADVTPMQDPELPPNAPPYYESFAVLDVGPKQEVVKIRFPRTGPAFNSNNGTATVFLEVATPGGQFQFQHARGAPIRLLNPDPTLMPSSPGNPGPQAGFSYKSPRYAPVVRYAEQLK